ncbi:hypothetical protein ACN09N_04275 [Aliarcobacter butzleri]|uniref:hypothetical protein n=1 Tax=Aliarcobacter butzleri TaxID=28197 RepID=UPI003AE57E58
MTYIVPNYFIEKNDSRIVDLEEVEKILKNKIYSEEFGWLADYVRLRVVANKL